MPARQTYEGQYRVIDFDTDGEYLLLYDTERDERVWVNRNGYDERRQQVVGRLRPGYLIYGIITGEPGADAPWDLEHAEILTHTTFATTNKIGELPFPQADEAWEQHDGRGTVVTSVTGDDGSVIYELELFPNEYEGRSVFDAINTGEWPVEPWFEELPITERAAAHVLVANPQERPYVAIIGFPDPHPAYDELLAQLSTNEVQYQNQESGSWSSGDATPSNPTSDQSSQSAEEPAGTNINEEQESEPPKSAESYTIGRVTVTPAPSDEPAAYQYSDLYRYGKGDWRITLLHAVYWPTYLLIIFPIQYVVRAFLWRFWTYESPFYRLQRFLSEGITNLQKLRFLTNRDRAVVYLRASRAWTPTQLIPMLPGTTPIREDPSAEQPPRPENWDDIRQAVYQRDNYHCVNCGAAGGPYGDTELHADHVMPRSKGGPDNLTNLRTLCRACHEARHARLFR